MMAKAVPGQRATSLLQALADGAWHELAVLSAGLDLDRRKLSGAAGQLAARGLMERAAGGRYRLTQAGTQAAAAGFTVTTRPFRPRRRPADSFRQRVWAAIRIRRVFTLGDVTSDASRGCPATDRANAQRYVAALCQAGFVVASAARRPGTAPQSGGSKVFRLVRNTGPRAPGLTRSKRAVYDPNTGEELPCAPR